MRRLAGLTPVEWTLAVALVGVLVATGLPRLIGGGMARNQMATRHELTAFAAAQQQVHNLGGAYATPRELCGVEPYLGKVRGPDMLGRPWPDLVPGGEAVALESGYRMAFWMDEQREYWALVAWPERWGETGSEAYAITQQGQLWHWQPESGAETAAAVALSAWGDAQAAATSANAAFSPDWHPLR